MEVRLRIADSFSVSVEKSSKSSWGVLLVIFILILITELKLNEMTFMMVTAYYVTATVCCVVACSSIRSHKNVVSF